MASTRAFELVAKASTASKIDFGTPQASSTKIRETRGRFAGSGCRHDRPAVSPGSKVPANAELHSYLSHAEGVPTVSLEIGHAGHATTLAWARSWTG